MPRRIAILGASGSVGSSLVVHLLRSRLLEPGDTLLLVGHGVLKTERKLLSTRIDLMDAFDDDRICIEIVPDVCDVEADIVIVAAGASLSAGQSATRRDLGATNRVVFEHIADQCASRLARAFFIVVSNPVELAYLCGAFYHGALHALYAERDRKCNAAVRCRGFSERSPQNSWTGPAERRSSGIERRVWSSFNCGTERVACGAARLAGSQRNGSTATMRGIH